MAAGTTGLVWGRELLSRFQRRIVPGAHASPGEVLKVPCSRRVLGNLMITLGMVWNELGSIGEGFTQPIVHNQVSNPALDSAPPLRRTLFKALLQHALTNSR